MNGNREWRPPAACSRLCSWQEEMWNVCEASRAGRGAQKTEPVGRQWSPGEAETVSGELALRCTALRCVGSRGEGSRADSQLLASLRRALDRFDWDEVKRAGSVWLVGRLGCLWSVEGSLRRDQECAGTSCLNVDNDQVIIFHENHTVLT